MPRSTCPVACTLDLLGDRWTLLVIRDLMRGKRRFGEFAASAERIPTNILAERLKRLEGAGLVETTAYTQHPPRFDYHLTERGWSLEPVMDAMARWGLAHIPNTRLPDRLRRASAP